MGIASENCQFSDAKTTKQLAIYFKLIIVLNFQPFMKLGVTCAECEQEMGKLSGILSNDDFANKVHT